MSAPAAPRAAQPPPAAHPAQAAAEDWQTGWHVYAVEWSAAGLDFYVDGVKYLSRTAEKVQMPTEQMYIIFDQAVDGAIFPPQPDSPCAPLLSSPYAIGSAAMAGTARVWT